MGLTPEQIAVKIGGAVITKSIVITFEKAISKFIKKITEELEKAGSWAFLKVQIKRCKKERCCLIFKRYNRKKDKQPSYYQCEDATDILGLYKDPADAGNHFSECEETFLKMILMKLKPARRR